MKVKQECSDNSEESTIVFKQENAFDVPANISAESMNYAKNQQVYSVLTVNVQEELQKEHDQALHLNSFHDVSETQYSEVNPSDRFVTPHDLNLIKQEHSENKYVIPKVEAFTEYCDLPTLKNDIDNLNEPSTSYYSQSTLEQSKPDAFKEKAKFLRKKLSYPCSICQKNYSSHYKRLDHLDGHFSKSWLACEFCGHFYSNKFEYCTHYFNYFLKKKTRNVLSVVKKYGTSSKSKNYYGKSKFVETNSLVIKNTVNHTVQKQFKCDLCLKHFTLQRSLSKHIKNHTNKETFDCKLCSKTFAHKYYLKQHVNVHYGIKPFKCKICSIQFTFKSSLNEHQIIHTGENLFKCQICSKQLKSKTNLKRHLIIHNVDKPFKCEFCSKQFAQKIQLTKHLKLHSNEKPSKSEICLEQFTSKQNLNEHVSSHTVEKPLKYEQEFLKFALKIIHSKERPFK